MKKLTLTLLSIMCFTLISCGSKIEEDTNVVEYIPQSFEIDYKTVKKSDINKYMEIIAQEQEKENIEKS